MKSYRKQVWNKQCNKVHVMVDPFVKVFGRILLTTPSTIHTQVFHDSKDYRETP